MIVYRLDADGLDLLATFLRYDARRRVHAFEAMRQPYFNSLGPSAQKLSDSKTLLSQQYVCQTCIYISSLYAREAQFYNFKYCQLISS